MSKNKKRQRIFTNRDFDDPLAWEYIEVEEYDDRQYLYWRAGERGCECCFPVCVEWVEECFAHHGRKYKPSGREFWKRYEDEWTGNYNRGPKTTERFNGDRSGGTVERMVEPVE